jgi:phage terminase small subunit
VSQNKPLTAKQEAFARNYVANGFNGTNAAIKAGYSETSAISTASEILTYPNVIAFIEELQKGTTERAKASADDLFEFLTYALTFNPSEWMNVTKSGNLVLKCEFDELPTHVQKLAVKIKPTMFGCEVTWFSKEKAAEMIARFHGMNNDKLKVETEYTGKSAAELAEIVKAKLAVLRLDE